MIILFSLILTIYFDFIWCLPHCIVQHEQAFAEAKNCTGELL